MKNIIFIFCIFTLGGCVENDSIKSEYRYRIDLTKLENDELTFDLRFKGKFKQYCFAYFNKIINHYSAPGVNTRDRTK